jgi:arachidonate 15-lipoxygenase
MVDYSHSFMKPDGTPLVRNNTANNTFLPAPIALFQYTAAKTFVPLAIQVESDTTTFPNSNVVYVRDPANGWQWRYAKTALQCADWNYHEIGSHLTKTHLVIEVIAISTHRIQILPLVHR